MEKTKPCILILLALFLVFNIVQGQAGYSAKVAFNVKAGNGNGASLGQAGNGNVAPQGRAGNGNAAPQDQAGASKGQAGNNNTTPQGQVGNGNATPQGQAGPQGQASNGNGAPQGQVGYGNAGPQGQTSNGNGAPQGQAGNGNATPQGQTSNGNGAPQGQAGYGNAAPQGQTSNGNGAPQGQAGNGNATPQGQTSNGSGVPQGQAGYGSDVSENYKMSAQLPTGQEQACCQTGGACYNKTLVCPLECPQRKPTQNWKQKACFVDCSSKCEVTCKRRKADCNGYGSLCYDPRFIGGDGVMFYFHGEKGGTFAIISDNTLQINAQFIGTRPTGRTRDFTWVQALSIMFQTHTLVIAAKKVPHWDDKSEALIIKWNGEQIQIPTDGEAEWAHNERQVVVERTDDFNNVRLTVRGLVRIDIRATEIGKQENLVHKYMIPDNDAFAHLEMQFKFYGLSDRVEGVLGKTYRPSYISPVKRGVAMPIMGGEDKYKTPSLYSSECKACRFQRPDMSAVDNTIDGLSQI